MKKQTLFISALSIGSIVFAQQVSKSEIQETANNIATELQIPASQRTSFTNEYTEKSIALQDLMQQNISAEEKVAKAKTILNQSSANLKKVTPTTQTNRYNTYFNKQAQLTAKVNNTKTTTVSKNTNTTKPTNTTNTVTSYTKNADYKKLPTDHQAVMDNIGAQLILDNKQFEKMSTDYLNFYNTTEDIKNKYSKNLIKAKIEFDNLIKNTNNSTKTYLDAQQSAAFEKLIKDGSLGKDTNPRITVSNTETTVATNNNKNLSAIKSAETLTQLRTALSLSATQYASALKVANNFDTEITKISAQFPNDINKQKTELDKKVPAYINQFKAALPTNQVNTYFGVLVTQVNILTGKDLTADQQKLIAIMKSEYKMNDVQIIQSMFIVTELKVRADANKIINKNNTQALNQENQKILGEANTKLKEILSTEQYNKMIADIEKNIK